MLPVGGVVRVRLLGALTMVDANQTDWKLLVLNVKVRRTWLAYVTCVAALQVLPR